MRPWTEQDKVDHQAWTKQQIESGHDQKDWGKISLLELLHSFPTMTLSRTRTFELGTPKRKSRPVMMTMMISHTRMRPLSKSWMDEN